ncbi:MAG: histidine kinase dimerization/phospho-acceptor domain-containing protein, partial [Acidimicrobiales bacterium]|nr:histidine kinase dimerization/phospho-acceptor domain-containing protein [Acidimicrobiales bacterium]
MRITLAAVAVTAVAVGTAGALLVRTVEDRETGRVRADIDADLDQVAAQLEDGMSPCEVMGSMDSRSSSGFLQISDPGGRVFTFATGPEGTLYSAQVHDGGGGFTASDDAALPPTSDVTGDPVLPCGEHPPDSGSATHGGLLLGEDMRIDGADRGGADRDGSDRDGETAAPGSEGAPPPPAGEQMQSVLLGRGGAVPGSIETVTRSVDAPEGPMTVVAAVPIDQLAGTVDTLRRGLSFGLPALIAVVAALAWVLVGRALRPVEAIRAEVDAITGSTMHRRVPVSSTGDEIGRLAHTMNAMLGRLDAAATRQRQFVSDASHELRSPVAALRTCLEVAGRRPDRADWPAVVDTALAEESRLEALLDDLLLLAAH